MDLDAIHATHEEEEEEFVGVEDHNKKIVTKEHASVTSSSLLFF